MKKIIGFICVSIFCCDISASLYMKMARVENNRIICTIKNDSCKSVNISTRVTDAADESIIMDESFSVFGGNMIIRANSSDDIEVSSIDAKPGHNYVINITGNSNSKIKFLFAIDKKHLLTIDKKHLLAIEKKHLLLLKEPYADAKAGHNYVINITENSKFKDYTSICN